MRYLKHFLKKYRKEKIKQKMKSHFFVNLNRFYITNINKKNEFKAFALVDLL